MTSPFDKAWRLLKDASMHGENPFKDIREQAFMEGYDTDAPHPLELEYNEPLNDLFYDKMKVAEAIEHSKRTAKPFTPPPEKTSQQRAIEELGLHPSELGVPREQRRFVNQVYPEHLKNTGKNRPKLDYPMAQKFQSENSLRFT